MSLRDIELEVIAAACAIADIDAVETTAALESCQGPNAAASRNVSRSALYAARVKLQRSVIAYRAACRAEGSPRLDS